MSTNSVNSIFICGALFEGDLSQDNLFLSSVQNLIVASKPATIQATVYRSKVGFPVLERTAKDIIKGTIFSLSTSDMGLHIIDELMGFSPQNNPQSLTHREIVKVQTDLGTEDVYVYFINPEKMTNELKYIENGDWETVWLEKPPIPKKLSEKQRNYIQKLGKSSGRDIVPIDLALYRELMNLELVIDKGRRIALTKLGQEVYRYL